MKIIVIFFSLIRLIKYITLYLCEAAMTIKTVQATHVNLEYRRRNAALRNLQPQYPTSGEMENIYQAERKVHYTP